MNTPISAILEALAFPPGNVLVLILVAGIVFRGRLRRIGIGAACVLLYVESTPALVGLFVAPLERYPPLDLSRVPKADAIVVLGGGRYSDAPEYGRDSASTVSLERLQYAVDLERATGLPIVTSGGRFEGQISTEAEIMADVMRNTFGVDRDVLVETRSRNTAENALFTKELLDAHGFRRILLVTHARDMPRALAMFEKYGVEVVPAPMRYQARHPIGVSMLGDWLPHTRAMQQFRDAAHEYVGMLWYRVRY